MNKTSQDDDMGRDDDIGRDDDRVSDLFEFGDTESAQLLELLL